MAGHISNCEAVPHRRVTSLIAPREHGAWGILLVPLATGGVVGLLEGGNVLPLVTFAVAALTLFWLRTPVESYLGTGLLRVQIVPERRAVGITILALATVAGCALGSLFWNRRNRELLPLGAIAVLGFVAQAFLRKFSRRTRMWSQVIGTIGLTVTAPAAYYVATGEVSRTALALWLANLLFSGNQIHFVQLRLHSARLNGWRQKLERGSSFLVGQLLLASVLVVSWRSHLLPALAALAFLPLFIRGTAWFFERQQSLAVRKLGWTELAHAVVFGVLLIAGFRLRG